MKTGPMKEGWGCKLGKNNLSIVFEDITSFKGGHVHSVTHRTVEAGNSGKSWTQGTDGGRPNGCEEQLSVALI